MSEQISVPVRTVAYRIVALRWAFAHPASWSVPSRHPLSRMVR